MSAKHSSAPVHVFFSCKYSLAQTVSTSIPTRSNINNPTSEHYTITSEPSRISHLSSIQTPASESSLNGQNLFTNSHQPQLPSQPKTLKFTLIAGKYWKFNIKTNSLQAKEKELRLHRNLSLNNFIIDDDGWFQYNHQQQQLFAWPSLYSKPSIYNYVLLPSGIDYESDGENEITSSDVVANIVVELIRPHYTEPRFDVDQLVDHKFTLANLHRHSMFPLLLNQIVSVFDFLTKSNNSPSAQSPKEQRSINNIRQYNKLNEYLLIDSASSTDGESFSVTWTLLPSLVNNTISTINECRLTTISDFVAKLSSPSLGNQRDSDKFVISYPLEGSFINSQAIVPAERGNNALRLTLNGPCRRQKFVHQLGLIVSTSNSYNGSDDEDESKSSISDRQAPSTTRLPYDLNSKNATIASELAEPTPTSAGPKTITTTTPTISLAKIITSTPSSITTSTNAKQPEINNSTEESENDLQHSLSPNPSDHIDVKLATTLPTGAPKSAVQHETHQVLDPSKQVDTTSSSESTRELTTKPTTSATVATSVPSQSESKVFNLSGTQRATDAQVIISERPIKQEHQQLHQVNTQISKPQAKSFANYLEQADERLPPILTTTATPEMNVPTLSVTNITSREPSAVMTTTTTTTISANVDNSPQTTPSLTPGHQETSIFEEFIGIANDTMEYLVSIAVPVAIIVGIILLTSIFCAICNLCMKRRKSKKFEMGNRFKFRYGSERRQFLRNSSKPVILEADQKSLSMGGTPRHKVVQPSTRTGGDDPLLDRSAMEQSQC